MKDKKFYSTNEVAALAGISRDTLLRWLRSGKVRIDPARDRNGWRLFSEAEKEAVVRYANKITPSPRRAQRELFRKRQRA